MLLPLIAALLLTACCRGSAPRTLPEPPPRPIVVTPAAPVCRDPGPRPPGLDRLGLTPTPSGEYLMPADRFAALWDWMQDERTWSLAAELCVQAMRAGAVRP